DRPPVRDPLPRQGRDAVAGDECLGGQVLAPALDAAGRRRTRLLPALGHGDVSPTGWHGPSDAVADPHRWHRRPCLHAGRRLPHLPRRHQRLVRTVATAGTGALALVRRRDVVADNEHLLRLGTALADAGLTWLTGSTAYLGKTAGSSGIRDVVEAFAPA